MANYSLSVKGSDSRNDVLIVRKSFPWLTRSCERLLSAANTVQIICSAETCNRWGARRSPDEQ